MIRPAFASLRVTKFPTRWVPSSQLVWQTTMIPPLLQARSVTVAALDVDRAEPRILVGTTYHPVIKESRFFDDHALIGELRQECTTIRKAMRSSKKLHASMGADELLSLNQTVGWINTKEEHCNKIIKLVSEYCLCQRVKPSNFKSDVDYMGALIVHHRTMQAAMKAKQSMDENDCIALEHAVEDLANMYTNE